MNFGFQDVHSSSILSLKIAFKISKLEILRIGSDDLSYFEYKLLSTYPKRIPLKAKLLNAS